MNTKHKLSAGPFSMWLRQMRFALLNQTGMDVPCGACNACCRASYFIYIQSTETDAIRHIPKKILFAAPRSAKGDVLMGYDEKGRCPMLINNSCSIYAHRPLTCRNYDCRIFSAAGISPDDEETAVRSREMPLWRFSYPEERDRIQHAAVKAASQFLQQHAHELPAELVPGNAIQSALLAIKVYDVLLRYDPTKPASPSRDARIINAIIKAHETFETRSRR
jgi:uncharacterized protein